MVASRIVSGRCGCQPAPVIWPRRAGFQAGARLTWGSGDGLLA